MSNLSDFGERKFIDYALRAQAAPSTTYYLGVSTSAFAEDVTPSNAASQEPSDSAYQRRSISFGTASSRQISNDTDIEFPEATASQGSIGYWAIFDGTGNTANTVAQGSFTTAKTVATGDVLRVATGDLDISVSSIWGLYWGNALLNGFFDADDYSTGDNSQDAFQSTTLTSTVIFSSTANGNKYRQYNNYYLGVSTSAFDLDAIHDGNFSTNTTGTFSVTASLTSDERSALNKEPWAPASPSPQFNNLNTVYDENSYDRTGISFSAASTSSGTTTMVNSAAVNFPEATASWGSIGYWAIFAHESPFAASTSQPDEYRREDYFNLFFPIIGGSFTSAKTIATGDVLRINAGDFILTPQ